MTNKDKELMLMMEKFKVLSEKEQGFILGLVEGILICKPNSNNKKILLSK